MSGRGSANRSEIISFKSVHSSTHSVKQEDNSTPIPSSGSDISNYSYNSCSSFYSFHSFFNYLTCDSKNTKKQTPQDVLTNMKSLKSSKTRVLSAQETSALHWASGFDYLMFSCGMVVGGGNLFLFPLHLLKYGTITFLSAYIPICVVFAYPLMFLKAGLGQFCSHGPGGCWEFARLFKGVGYATIFLVIIYTTTFMRFNVLFSLIQYLFIYGYPWDSENQEIYSDVILWFSIDFEKFNSKERYQKNLNTTTISNRVNIIQEETISNISTPGDILQDSHNRYTWKIYICYFFTFMFCFIFLLPDIKTRGKIASMAFPFVALSLCLICVRSLALPGAMKGIQFGILSSHETTLLDTGLWITAFRHCYISLSIHPGYHMTMASYNHFNNVICSDILLLIIVDLFFSGVGSLILFSFLGHLSEKTTFQLEDINMETSAIDMAILLLPRSMTYMEEGGLGWIFFFFTIFNIILHLNITSKFEVVITGVIDVFEIKTTSRKYVVLIMCTIMFITSIWICTKYHTLITYTTRHLIYNHINPPLGLCFVVALLYSLGVDRFISMLECSVGWYTTPIMSNRWWKLWWKISWKYIVPCVLLALFANSLSMRHYHPENYNTWMLIVGRLLQALFALVIFGPMAYMIATTRDHGGFVERIRFLTKPSPDWGPLLPQHRYIMEVGEEDRLKEQEKRKRRKSSIIKSFSDLIY